MQDNTACFQDIAPIRDFERQVGILFDQKDGGVVLLVDFFYDPEDLPGHQRRQSHGWFVQEQELRPGHQRPGNSQHLLLAAGQVTGPVD